MSITEGNKASWNACAEKYSVLNHSDKMLSRILHDPVCAFHHTTWQVIMNHAPDLRGSKICVPSSGDNLAVFAFAMLGAHVTSCDIAENQLACAQRVSRQYDWGKNIEYICADTMALDGIKDSEYDFVYTSNGVHVWISDLQAMYRNIHRIMKPGGGYIMFEIHPFERPFDGEMRVKKPYDSVGPFQFGSETIFHWRLMDLFNAILQSGLAIGHVEEMFAEKDYDLPFWISLEDMLNGATATSDEVNDMHDWKKNPAAALPSWICIAARKMVKE